MRSRGKSYALLAYGMLFLCLAAGATAETGDVADTRILIDISGSMKKNDPGNLRRPAVRMLVGLLPAGTRAGVWTFGQYVNMQVRLAKVDEGWRIKARRGAGEIHSRGMFTNIEEVLRRATADWEGNSKKYRRNLVLLTDGMVDVSKKKSESRASRKRILDQVLPRLKQLGARVHTIALSARADHELMQTLSDETGGWYEQVNDADQLQRIFLRIFEKVNRPDTVPLQGNRFQIDASIDEATLLVFRPKNAAPTQIIPPTGKAITADAAPDDVRWHRDQGYDLITIANPPPGEWSIQAALDPDNRVVVVTDLKMHSSELPPKLIQGEQLPLHVHFTDHGKPLAEQRFLDVVRLQGELGDTRGPGQPQPIVDNGEGGDQLSGDGVFTLMIGAELAPGPVTMVVNAQSETFQRQQQQRFELLSPVALAVTDADPADSSLLKVSLTPVVELLLPQTIAVQAELFGIDQAEEIQPLMLLPAVDGLTWEGSIDRTALAGDWQLRVHFAADSVQGNRIDFDLEPVNVRGLQPVSPPVVDPPPVAATAEEVDDPAEKSSNWLEIGLFAGGNLLGLLLAVGGFWLVRRRQAADFIQLVSDEAEEGVA